MYELKPEDIFTKVTKYNLIRAGRMLYIDVHESLQGTLAGKYVAVPNLVSIIATQDYQGAGETEQEALRDCLRKIKDAVFEEIFPQKDV